LHIGQHSQQLAGFSHQELGNLHSTAIVRKFSSGHLIEIGDRDWRCNPDPLDMLNHQNPRLRRLFLRIPQLPVIPMPPILDRPQRKVAADRGIQRRQQLS
jgi:hypothetical protein